MSGCRSSSSVLSSSTKMSRGFMCVAQSCGAGSPDSYRVSISMRYGVWLLNGVRLLRTPEQSAVQGFRENVSLDGLHHVRPCLEGVGGRLHVDRRIQRVELEHVVMLRAVRARTRPAIHLPGRADLKGAVGQLRSF